MHVGLTVLLPRGADSVPFIRVLCRQALEHLRIDDDRCRIQVTDQARASTRRC